MVRLSEGAYMGLLGPGPDDSNVPINMLTFLVNKYVYTHSHTLYDSQVL